MLLIKDIINYLKENYKILIGEVTAENIKKEMGSVIPSKEETTMG